MCAPAVMMVMMVASAAMTAASEHQQGQFQQAVANQNADIERQKATQSQQIGSIQSNQQVLRTRQIIGAQTAAMGASGGVVDTGSSSQVLNDTQMSGTTNANITANNSMGQAWGYNTQAGLEVAQGNMAATSGNWSAGSTLMSSAASVYGMGNKYYGWGAKS